MDSTKISCSAMANADSARLGSRLIASRRLALSLLLLGTLAGCATTQSPAPVSPSGARSAPAAASTEYTVQRGETLISISSKFQVDHKELARWNGINPPYLIRPGQKLKVQSPAAPAPSAAPPPEAAAAPAAKSSGGFFSWFGGGGSSASGSGSSGAGGDDPFSDFRSGGVRTAPVGQQAAPSLQTIPSGAPGRPPTADPGNAWQWPVVGGSRLHHSADNQVQGLRIKSGIGQPVYAARDGKVTFVNTFPGYGELLIIDHDGEYLSAYGFIRKAKVKEGQTVRKGTAVAEVGEGSDGELHFEIRHEGKPIDPAKLLPRNQ